MSLNATRNAQQFVAVARSINTCTCMSATSARMYVDEDKDDDVLPSLSLSLSASNVKLRPHPKPTEAKFPPGCLVALYNPKYKRIHPACTVTSISAESIHDDCDCDCDDEEKGKRASSSREASRSLCFTAYYDLVDERNQVYRRVPQAFLEFHSNCPVLVLFEFHGFSRDWSCVCVSTTDRAYLPRLNLYKKDDNKVMQLAIIFHSSSR